MIWESLERNGEHSPLPPPKKILNKDSVPLVWQARGKVISKVPQSSANGTTQWTRLGSPSKSTSCPGTWQICFQVTSQSPAPGPVETWVSLSNNLLGILLVYLTALLTLWWFFAASVCCPTSPFLHWLPNLFPLLPSSIFICTFISMFVQDHHNFQAHTMHSSNCRKYIGQMSTGLDVLWSLFCFYYSLSWEALYLIYPSRSSSNVPC